MIAAIAAFVVVPVGVASPTPEIGRAADAVVAAGAPGVAVYARDGNRTTLVARGYDNLETKRRMIPRDRFRIGSVTKTFVAAATLQLVGEGKLRLSDTIEEWLPGLVPNGDHITIRSLLAHRSGLFDYIHDDRILAPYVNGQLDYAWTPREILRMATEHEPVFAPGAAGKQSYSSTNYFVLGLLVERVTGHSLAHELSKRIFDPLRLRHTALPATPKTGGRYAHGYTYLFGPTPFDITGLSPSLFWAAGGIVSTPAEVARFYRALLTGRLLPRYLLEAMKARQVPPEATPGILYGLGIYRVQLPCGYVWGHNGDIPGFDTTAFSSGDGDRQVVVSVNTDEDSFTPAAADALEALLGQAYCG